MHINRHAESFLKALGTHESHIFTRKLEGVTQCNSPLEIPLSSFSATGTFALFCAVQNKGTELILLLKDKDTLEKKRSSVLSYPVRRKVRRLEFKALYFGWARLKLSKSKSAT